MPGLWPGGGRQGGAQGTHGPATRTMVPRAALAPPSAQPPPPRCVSLCLARSRPGQEEGYFRRCEESMKGK